MFANLTDDEADILMLLLYKLAARASPLSDEYRAAFRTCTGWRELLKMHVEEHETVRAVFRDSFGNKTRYET